MEPELEVQKRLEKTNSHTHEMRNKGLIPAVVYGKNIGSMAIEVNARELQKILAEAGSNALISMKFNENGKTKRHKVLVKAVQRDPLHRNLVHADFHQISLKDRIHTTVPVVLNGTAPGVLVGGLLSPLLRRVEVECLPTQIPEAIVVDISGLEVGDVISVADLVLPPDVRINEDLHAAVVTVAAPGRESVETVAPAKEEKAEPGESGGEDASK
ncbi:MAG: 50S ribosomal protein L25/general stress protein Ctc [Desulfotomaculaceae bacterium]|nr:50S ribosomal protein L25/general stress protein Ctc [Desulfotomaculaceae bacterium]